MLFGGIQVITVPDHLLPPGKRWLRPKPPSKRAGRKGTRKGWKRLHPPGLYPVPGTPPDTAYVINGRLCAPARLVGLIKGLS